jgi:uncharacterized protein with NAD-binding domain and iron-sulfur cluster
MQNSNPGNKKRALVLGAGPAGLSAAFALIESGEYDVDVYQMGWRAGGKCATGRDPGHFRTRQNGSHYLFGCYHNAFALIRRAHQVLSESKDDADKQFGKFFDDFVARNLLVGAQGYNRIPRRADPDKSYWYRYMPQNMACPGTGTKFVTPFDYAFMTIQLIFGTIIDFYAAIVSDETDEERFEGCRLFVRLLPVSPFETSLWSRVLRLFLHPLRFVFNLIAGAVVWVIKQLIIACEVLVPSWLSRLLFGWWKRSAFYAVAVLRIAAQQAERAALAQEKNASNGMQRLIILFELALAIATGFLSDELWRAGSFEKIDSEDLRHWLRRHGASQLACESSLVRTWYDATISYRNGQQGDPSCSAGVAVQAMLRSILTYKGAFAFQMRAEVGDSYIAPLVRALELLGVKFHFYHRVTELRVSSATQSVEELVINQQIANPPKKTEFLDVHFGPEEDRKVRKGWPSAALQPAAQGHAFPLDSYYSNVQHRAITLRRSVDFDVVVCALPVGVVQDVLVDSRLGPLANLDGPWREMFEHLRLTESQAIRMWFKVSLTELGWRHEPPILSGTDWPHSTWEDNSQAKDIQNFPQNDQPGTIGTLFGPLETGAGDIRSPNHYASQLQIAQRNAQTFLYQSMPALWPGLVEGNAIAWSKFIDLEGRSGEQRFGFQVVAANVGPNESYVVAWPGSLKYRARPDESGYQHLYLAGDWTRNGIEAGTVEGAVISGLKAAHAITGKGETIVGGNDFDFGTVFA